MTGSELRVLRERAGLTRGAMVEAMARPESGGGIGVWVGEMTLYCWETGRRRAGLGVPSAVAEWIRGRVGSEVYPGSGPDGGSG